MNCINCGQEIGSEVVCPNCGYDLSVEIKALKLSNMYYNMGLDKAQIRDMSGAIDLLERSLKFNKKNIEARNLLGLVYFETGEVVAALSEWVISKNMMPDRNIASEYISRVQADQTKLETIQQTIKRYNRALDTARTGETDIAIIMLKKVISANPKLIKACYLLALLYMKTGEYEKARKVLKKAAPIDRTNATLLRFLIEIDERTGTVTDLESINKGIVKEKRRWLAGLFKRKENTEYRINNGYMTTDWDDEEEIISAPVIQPIAFHQIPAFVGLVNIIIGVVLGAFVIGLIAVPATKQSINRSAEEKVTNYSTQLVAKDERISELENQINEYSNQIDSGNDQISEAGKKVEAYEKLLKAYSLYTSNNIEQTSEVIAQVDSSLLSDDALSIYNTISEDINSQQFDEAYNKAFSEFQRGNFSLAISDFTTAKNLKSDNYASIAYLAHSYRLNNQPDDAITVFQEIVDKFPNTERASKAENYIKQLKNGDDTSSVGIAAVNTEIAVGEIEESNQ